MHLFVTGVSGLVGSAVAEAAVRRGHTVTGVVHAWNGAVPHVREVLRMDLRNAARLTSEVLERFPDAIVNCAGITENAPCEADPQAARALNVELPQTLAQLAHHLSARLVQLSTDLVFDGARPPYRPGDALRPGSLYAQTKAAGEAAVLEAAPDFAVVLRLPVVNGNSPSGMRSLHERLFAGWAAGNAMELFTDEVRQPATASNIADVVVELCERQDLRGTHHWGGAAPVSRADMGRLLIEHFRLPGHLLRTTQAGDDPRFASRPRNLSMDISALAGVLRTRPQRFEEQLDELIVPKPCRAWFHSLPGAK